MLHFVFYTDSFIPTRFAAITIGPMVLVRPAYKGDEGLLQHELTHVKQFWHNPLFFVLYAISKTARFNYEVEAYRVQLKYYPDDRTDIFADFLVNDYRLGITNDQAIAALKAVD